MFFNLLAKLFLGNIFMSNATSALGVNIAATKLLKTVLDKSCIHKCSGSNLETFL